MNDNQIKSQFWRERLEAQKSSGLSIHTWCRENQIPQSQFFYWKRKFNREVKRVRPCVQLRVYNPAGGNPVK